MVTKVIKAASSKNDEGLWKISWQSIVYLLRYFSLEQRGANTDNTAFTLIRIKLGKSPAFCTSKARCRNNTHKDAILQI